MTNLQINVEGLSDFNIQMVNEFIGYLKATQNKTKEEAHAEFSTLWEQMKKTDPDMTEEEIDDLVNEAIAWARGKKV